MADMAAATDAIKAEGPQAMKRRLPVVDELGFYEIRLDSIGGLGAHLAGQLLGTVGVLKMGLNASHFSSYGSEKTGSPIKSFVRYANPEQQIRTSSPVERPHMVAVFHDALLKVKGGLTGLRSQGILIINTAKSFSDLKAFDLPEDCFIYLLDALAIAVAEKSRVNTAMMGAVTKASGFLDPDAVVGTLSEMFAKKHPAAVEYNTRANWRGFKELRLEAEPKPGFRGRGDEKPSRPNPLYGYLTAPIGGCVVSAGSSIMVNTNASRQGFLPVYHSEECVHCGLCDLVCPDRCLVWKEEAAPEDAGRLRVRLQGIDYNYCKGCMRCVDSCPTGALTKEREEEGFADTHRFPAFPDIRP